MAISGKQKAPLAYGVPCGSGSVPRRAQGAPLGGTPSGSAVDARSQIGFVPSRKVFERRADPVEASGISLKLAIMAPRWLIIDNDD